MRWLTSLTAPHDETPGERTNTTNTTTPRMPPAIDRVISSALFIVIQSVISRISSVPLWLCGYVRNQKIVLIEACAKSITRDGSTPR